MKVLSIDGGGVRGIIPARILQEIEKKTGKHTSELFDIISGTSTGGLLAMGITKPGKDHEPAFFAEDLVKLYLSKAEEIFASPTLLHKIATGFGLWGSKYDRANYDKVLLEVFEDTLLSETIKPVFVPIYSLRDYKPLISSTLFALNNKENDFYLKDIAAAAGAAPTYFKPKLFKSPNGKTIYQGVDGGIYANNPELIGIIGIYLYYPDFKVDDIILVSLGTGDTRRHSLSNSDWGKIGWLTNKDIINDMIDAESAIAELVITTMLKHDNHFRLQLSLPDHLAAMDNSNYNNLNALLKIAEDYIQINHDLIDNLCNVLI